MTRKPYSEKQRADDFKIVFGSPVGRKVLTDILVKASVFAPIAHADPQECLRMEGARALALHIASFVRFDADKFLDAWRPPEDVD